MKEILFDNIDTVITELITLAPFVIAAVIWIRKIVEGIRCQLRQDMLDIYYHCKDKGEIRQYQAEHFDKCYHAYKALKGNSFIDDIYAAKRKWKVIT